MTRDGDGNGDVGHRLFDFAEPSEFVREDLAPDEGTDSVMDDHHLDCRGNRRHFRLELYGGGPASFLSATELRDGEATGLRFVMQYDESTQAPPYGEIRKKIDARLAVRHVDRDPDTLEWTPLTTLIRAQIGSASDHEVPSPDLVIDDETVSWDELGAMLRAYEGFGVRIRITEPGDE